MSAELLLDDLERPDNVAAIPDAGLFFADKSNRRSRFLIRWRLGIVGAIVLSVSVFAVNFGPTLWVTTNFQSSMESLSYMKDPARRARILLHGSI